MSKKLKDYLHFYLGCEVMTPDGKSKILCIYSEGELPIICPDTVHSDWDYKDVKPILRPLSSLTDEECIESNSVSPHFIEGTSQEYIGRRTHVIRESLCNHRGLTPERCRWLLSKHYDIFGLIESGLALDATKLLPHE